jgi:hypothetical protein
MSWAMSLVVSDNVARVVPTINMIERTLAGGHRSGAGNTAEKARRTAGIMQALANVTRPHSSVLVLLSTPEIPRTQPAVANVRRANQRLTGLRAGARQT